VHIVGAHLMWAANSQHRRAYRVARHIKSRDVLVLVCPCGCEFEEPPARLEAHGYRIVKSRPAYAEPGHYGRTACASAK